MPIAKVLHNINEHGYQEGRPVKVWTDTVESSAEEQLLNLAKLPFIHKHVAVMPDVHAGIGSTVGSVIATKRAIIPAAVGVDIGCGMIAQKLAITAKDLPDSLAAMRSAIEAAVPHGRSDNGGKNDRGAWGDVPPLVSASMASLGTVLNLISDTEAVNNLRVAYGRADRQLGTLGTGNHFVEVCLDLEDNVWVMLHSGSRGVGNKIGTYFIDRAKEEMERWHVQVPHKDLAFLPENTPLFRDYWKALSWAQQYATMNRQIMMAHTLGAIRETLGRAVVSLDPVSQAVNCHHNYAAIENHYGENVYVTRKGAVRARAGDLGIIPGSMGAKSFIVRGLGNPESFCSCSHGAGRTMSRTQAKHVFTIEDLKAQTEGIECRKDAEVIDEIPGAYKNIDEVMAHQSDLVEVVAQLRQVLCVKG